MQLFFGRLRVDERHATSAAAATATAHPTATPRGSPVVVMMMVVVVLRRSLLCKEGLSELQLLLGGERLNLHGPALDQLQQQRRRTVHDRRRRTVPSVAMMMMVVMRSVAVVRMVVVVLVVVGRSAALASETAMMMMMMTVMVRRPTRRTRRALRHANLQRSVGQRHSVELERLIPFTFIAKVDKRKTERVGVTAIQGAVDNGPALAKNLAKHVERDRLVHIPNVQAKALLL